MSAHSSSPHIAVIGAGPGGYAAAFKAADLGLAVTLIDKEENPGGVCLYRGCIPSKALLHVAKLITESKEASHWGISFSAPKIDLNRLRAWKTEVVQKLTSGLGHLCKARGINQIQGQAYFADNRTINITKNNGTKQTLTVDYAILATGSTPSNVPGFSVNGKNIMDSTSALELENIPESLLVIGGGYIGLELATVYNALGSNVTVVEMTSGLLQGADRDLVNILEKRLEDNHCMEILLDTKVLSIKELKSGIKVTLEGDAIKKLERTFEKVLISIGRKPNAAGLGLENTKVQFDDRGFVTVDPYRRTGDSAIFAIGDIAGEPMLAHKATHEGIIAAEVIAGSKAAFEPHAIPAVVFTDPEIAWCGLTETEAQRDNRIVNVSIVPWSASGRAKTFDRAEGITKLLVDPETERILGVGICGPNAGELIAEGTLAIEMAALASDLKMVIHPHPTLSETIMEAADIFYGSSTHLYRKKT